MHALLVELFPWLVALWAVDGLVQLGRGHLLFVRGAAGGFRALEAGLHVLPLSPLAEAVAAHDLPFLDAPGRVFVFDARRRTEPALVAAVDLEPLRRDGLAPVTREGRRVRAAGRVALHAPTPEWAERLRGDLEGLAGGAAPEQGRLDVAGAAALRARAGRFAPALRAAAALLFATTFGAWPAAAYAPGATTPFGPAAVLASAGALVALVAILAFAMLRACGEPAGRSAAAALHLVVYPVAALRPLVHAPRSLFRRFDALTVAAALLPPDRFGALAARELRRARLSRAETPPELAAFWEGRARALAALLAEVGISEADALAPPTRSGGAEAWCPLCGAQFRAGYDRCADCGVATEPFGP
jgi:hypothetical protein